MSPIVLEYDGEGMVRGATFVEFRRDFGFHQGHYRVQMADPPELPFGDKPWYREWYKNVLEHSTLVTHHVVRTPPMLVTDESLHTFIMKLDQPNLRKNYNQYGWYERVYMDKQGHIDEWTEKENGKTVVRQVPRTTETLRYRNIKTDEIEHELTHAYIAVEVSRKRVWAAPDDMCLYIEYNISVEVYRMYARQYNTWNSKYRFLNAELGLSEVWLCLYI